MAKGIAIGLLIASLVLLLIYGGDVMVATSSSPQDGSGERRGFLPLSESVRGGGFGGGAVVMSTIGFVIARKDYAPAVSALLFVNGGLIIAGMLGLIVQGALASEDSSGAMRTIGSTIVLGVVLVGLGAWKTAIDRRVVAAKSSKPAPK